MRFLQMYTSIFIHFPIPKNPIFKKSSFFFNVARRISFLYKTDGYKFSIEFLHNWFYNGYKSLSKLHEHCKWRGSK